MKGQNFRGQHKANIRIWKTKGKLSEKKKKEESQKDEPKQCKGEIKGGKGRKNHTEQKYAKLKGEMKAYSWRAGINSLGKKKEQPNQ